MTCDSCGRELPPDARFCPGCGTAVAGTERAEAPPVESNAPVEAAAPVDATDPAAASASESLASADSGKPGPKVATLVGNLLAIAAGGTLGVLTGFAIRQVM